MKDRARIVLYPKLGCIDRHNTDFELCSGYFQGLPGTERDICENAASAEWPNADCVGLCLDALKLRCE